MAQARKKRVKKAKKPRQSSTSNGVTRSCIGFLFAGALVGMLGTLLFQGMQADSTQDVGSGLRDMMQKARLADEQRTQDKARKKAKLDAQEPVLTQKSIKRAKPKFDFYTVLPEFEEVLPKDAPEPPPVKRIKVAASKNKAKTKGSQKKTTSVYALQVASYGRHADADKLKAELALRGWPTTIQTVSIDNKTYYRVRVGPFKDYGNMTSADYELGKMGHKAMRLRLSKGG